MISLINQLIQLSACRKKWIGICADISRQTNRAVVFYGDLTPDTFSGADEEYRKSVCVMFQSYVTTTSFYTVWRKSTVKRRTKRYAIST